MIALTTAACGSNSVSSSTASKPSGGSSAMVTTPTPSPTAAPSVQPFNVGGYLAGNATPTFPAGEPGQVSIVAHGPLKKPGSGAILPIAFRNNNGAAISHVDLSATARLNGKLVASGKSQGTTPAQVQPGEVGLAFIYFEDSKSMADTGLEYEFTAETMPADTSSYNTAPLNGWRGNLQRQLHRGDRGQQDRKGSHRAVRRADLLLRRERADRPGGRLRRTG